MTVRKRDRIEFILWAIISVGLVTGISRAHYGLVTVTETLEKCPYAQAQR